MDKLSIEKIEEAIGKAKPEEQRSCQKLSEPSFEFWNNPEDAIYDQI